MHLHIDINAAFSIHVTDRICMANGQPGTAPGRLGHLLELAFVLLPRVIGDVYALPGDACTNFSSL